MGSTPGQERDPKCETRAPRGFFGSPRARVRPDASDTIPDTSSTMTLPVLCGRGGAKNADGGENTGETLGRAAAKIDGSDEAGRNADIRTPVPPTLGDSCSHPAASRDFAVAIITFDCQMNETMSKAAAAERRAHTSGAIRPAELNILLVDSGSEPDHLEPGSSRD